eukprot:4516032-Alexandrium_andersonii.AAC.1
MYVAGISHIVRNLSKALTEVFSLFDEWFMMLKAAVVLLNSRPCRELFVASCLQTGPGHAFANLADSFHVSLAEWRWGTMILAMDSVIGAWPMLGLWDEQKYNRG